MSKKRGLSQEDHHELASGMSRREIADLRNQYRDDPKAQEQIDRIDPASGYGDRVSEYIAAVREGRAHEAQEIRAALNKDYPLTAEEAREPWPGTKKNEGCLSALFGGILMIFRG